MSILNRRLLFYNLAGAIIGLPIGVLLITARPSVFLILFALFLIVLGQAGIMTWSKFTTSDVKDKKLILLYMFHSLFCMAGAMTILVFRTSLEHCVILFGALALLISSASQHMTMLRYYRVSSRKHGLYLSRIAIVAIVFSLLFFTPVLFPEIRKDILAFLIITYSVGSAITYGILLLRFRPAVTPSPSIRRYPARHPIESL